MALRHKKSGAQAGAPDKSDQHWGWWPEPGGGAWPRTRVTPAIAALRYEIRRRRRWISRV